MNQYVKVALAVLAALAVGLQSAYPHAAWVTPVTDSILALLSALHFRPTDATANAPAGV